MALLSFAPLFFAQPAHAVPSPATITCSDSAGNSRSWNVQWDNANQYFQGKGNIAAHFCEGGYGGSYTTFVGVTTWGGDQLEPSLLYYNGVIPQPDIPAEPVQSTQDVDRSTGDTTRVTEEVVRTEDVIRTEDVVRTEEVVREPEPEPAPVEPAPPVEPEIVPEPAPEPEPTPESPVEPVEPIEPEVEESPQPEPVEPPTEPTEPEISPEVPTEPENEPIESFEDAVEAIQEAVGEAVEAVQEAITETFESAVEAVAEVVESFQTAGLDMTVEERKQAQSVVVPSVIVAQIATLTFRK